MARIHVPGVPGQLLLQGLVVAKTQQPVLFGVELFRDHGHPSRVGEVARGQNVYTLDRGPGREIPGSEVLARSPGKSGMNNIQKSFQKKS